MPSTPDFNVARDLEKVRALTARISYPHWMHRPGTWTWTRPDGMSQGFSSMIYTQPGLCNLLWLAMDLDRPPEAYNALANPLYMLLVVNRDAKLRGEPLTDMAALLTLRQFHDLLPESTAAVNPVEHAYPLLRLLAERRLDHAHP
jgi:hypothetical protein